MADEAWTKKFGLITLWLKLGWLFIAETAHSCAQERHPKVVIWLQCHSAQGLNLHQLPAQDVPAGWWGKTSRLRSDWATTRRSVSRT